MKTHHGVRTAAVLAALMGINLINLIPASAAPPPPPPATHQVIGGPSRPRRIVEIPGPRRDQRPLDVEIEMLGGDGRLIYPGQPVGFSFRVNRDAFVVIYDIDTEGRTHLLYPRGRWDSEFVQGDVSYQLPGRGAVYRLVADGPAGEEFVVAVASDEPIANRWLDCWNGMAGSSEFDRLGDTSARVGLVRGDRFLAMDRVASRLIDVPVEHLERVTARDYTSFYIGDPTCRRGPRGRGHGNWRHWHRR